MHPTTFADKRRLRRCLQHVHLPPKSAVNGLAVLFEATKVIRRPTSIEKMRKAALYWRKHIKRLLKSVTACLSCKLLQLNN